MFEKNEEITGLVKVLWEEFGTVINQKDVLLWKDVERVTGLKRPTGPWRDSKWATVVNNFRKRLMEDRQLDTDAEKGVGIRVLTDSEILSVKGERRRKKMFRQSTKLKKEFACIDSSKLSLHERRQLIAQKDALSSERRLVRQSINALRKTETNPIRKVSVFV